MKFYILIFVVFFLALPSLLSKPSYSMLSGNRCLNCHITPNGGGIRNQLGVYSKEDASLINPESIGMKNFFTFFKNVQEKSAEENSLYFGLDGRFQSLKWGAGSDRFKIFDRKIFIMQMTPYIAYYPFEWMSVNAQYNLAELTGNLYRGQKSWSAGINIQPDFEYPMLRFGFIQPSIGGRHDDHTLLIRQTAGQFGAYPYLPPDYTEWGAELSYNYYKWISATVGAFKSESMSENFVKNKDNTNIPLVDKNKIFALARLEFFPRFFDGMLNLNFGGSYYTGDNFNMMNLFFNAGITDKIALLTEYASTNKKDLRTTDNFLIELDYQILPSIILFARAEKAFTKELLTETYKWTTYQYVIGANFYLLPYLDIKPEYRIYDRAHVESSTAQYTLQIHFYY
ncbi:MAG: hypothetical protein N2319_06690 [Candidatus Kapabacteria bacterium]|nr:hypothetical protein [Candidatus Kapabacteria bacterium]